MENDLDNNSSSESGSEDAPRYIVIEDEATRTQWLPVTSEAERSLIATALTTLDALPEADADADVMFKPDKLAISKVAGPGNMKRQMVYRIRYLGNTELWLQNDTSNNAARRIVALPEHAGAQLPRGFLKTDTKQTKTLSVVLSESTYAATNIQQLDAKAGTIWIQGFETNQWTALTGEERTAVIHAIAAIQDNHVHYAPDTEHVVTLLKTKGTASSQVFRTADHRLWLAEINKGAGKPKWFRLVIIAGEHHAVPRR